jgi:hypothetical protein
MQSSINRSNRRIFSSCVKASALIVLIIGAYEGNLASAAHAQVSQSPKSGNVMEIVAKASADNPDSLYFVEQLAQVDATQAIPMLEQKFEKTTPELDKAHIASVTCLDFLSHS